MLDMAPGLVLKKLVVDPGRRISLQRHAYRSERYACRSERWVVMQGVATVQRAEEQLVLRQGEEVAIPQHCLHRLSNESTEPIVVLEIQVGGVLSEDDIVRFDDDFGRHE